MRSVFSPMEEKVIKIIGKNHGISIQRVAGKYYNGRRKKPFNPGNTMAGTIKRINKKCSYHRLDWFINSVGGGRSGKQVWVDG